MTNLDDENEEGIVRSAEVEITKRSALVRRSLSSLTEPSWTFEQLFENAYCSGSVSPFGLVADSNSKMIVDDERARIRSQTVEIVDFLHSKRRFSMESLGESSYIEGSEGLTSISRDTLERMVETNTYSMKGRVCANAESAVSFAWSPCGNYLLTGAGNHECTLRFFDIRQRILFDSFRAHGDSLFYLDWSSDGEYVVSASPIRDPRLIVWKCNWVNDLFGRQLKSIWKHSEITSLEPYPRHYYDPTQNDWYGFYGFQKCAFSPDGKLLIANVSIRNYNDLFVVFELPTVSEVNRVDLEMGNEVQSLSWTLDSKTLFYCIDNQLMRLAFDDSSNSEIRRTELSFDRVACNPKYDVVAVGRGRYGFGFRLYVNKGLGDLFAGDNPTPESKEKAEFDEEVYKKAKPFFQAGYELFKDTAQDVSDAMRLLIEYLSVKGFDDKKLYRIKTYTDRFISEIQNQLNQGAQEVFLGSLIQIRRISDLSIVTEFSGPSGIVDLRWSADGNKLWAMCRDGSAVQGVLPIGFRK